MTHPNHAATMRVVGNWIGDVVGRLLHRTERADVGVRPLTRTLPAVPIDLLLVAVAALVAAFFVGVVIGFFAGHTEGKRYPQGRPPVAPDCR